MIITNFLHFTDLSALTKLLAILCPIFLYGEIHFRLPFLKGRIFKKEPEIIFDLPHRIESGHLPVLLLIKDSHLFPITLKNVTIRILSSSNKVLEKIMISENIDINQKWFTKIYKIDLAKYTDQNLEVNCCAEIKLNHRTSLIVNDNYKGLSHKNFLVFVDSETIPGSPEWVWGDMHCHSSWTEDRVEFGVPAKNIYEIANSMGISFCSLIDHSYDLDDLPDSMTETDPELTTWYKSRRVIKSLNESHPDFLIIPGEELSVDNGLGENVHLGVLNCDRFFEGTGDGFENLSSIASEFHYAKVLEQLPENSLAFAAHPQAPPPFIQKLLIKRGGWNNWDAPNKLSGYQAMNGVLDDEFERGKREWIKLLLKGKHIYIFAGNDSHGNFNRFRQLKLPFLSLWEKNSQIFAEFRTGVKTSVDTGLDALVAKLKTGSVIVSNGPFIDLKLFADADESADIGATLKKLPHTAAISLISSKYYGSLEKVKVFTGNFSQRKEVLQNEIRVSGYSADLEISLPKLHNAGYLRAEIYTHKEKFALTNPVWF